jgi:hypothetical protein
VFLENLMSFYLYIYIYLFVNFFLLALDIGTINNFIIIIVVIIIKYINLYCLYFLGTQLNFVQ